METFKPETFSFLLCRFLTGLLMLAGASRTWYKSKDVPGPSVYVFTINVFRYLLIMIQKIRNKHHSRINLLFYMTNKTLFREMLNYCPYHQMIQFGTPKMMMVTVTMMTDILKQVNMIQCLAYLCCGFKCI